MTHARRLAFVLGLLLSSPVQACTSASQEPAPAPQVAERPPVVPGGSRNPITPDPIGLAQLIHEPQSELAPAVRRWAIDADRLQRLYPVRSSPAFRARMSQFHRAWLAELTTVEWKTLSRPAQVDALALRTWIERRVAEIALAEKNDQRIAPLVGFAATITDLAEACARIEAVDARGAAEQLDRLAKAVSKQRKDLEAQYAKDAECVTRFDASRAAKRVDALAAALRRWFEFYDGYDPLFTWWAKAPYGEASRALDDYAKFLRERIVKVGSGEDDIVGDPIGSEALSRALADEWIPYTAEELLALAEQQFAWCETELRRAANDMGCGDDWKRALELVKQSSVPPGEQPALIRDLTLESIAFLRAKDLITVPSLAAETWRMDMMSPDAQRSNPFFLGGDAIQVSYPTDTMSHDEKMMSMRGNNPHFSRAVVHHEVIAGHNLQGFMEDRYNQHRGVFSTPFWTEGWALYWEMLLWNKGFAATPEDRIGMLFWRTHRCARIVFSLKFHLGEMSSKECIDFLVERVGHERANAAAEVRRSFGGDYSPLYQVGYLLGGLQFMALHHEQVDSGKLTDRQFHDAVIRASSLPVELVRALFTQETLTPDMRTHWRFADPR
ncbi:MAG TPA: DUF885 family protein [Planctomycetota bacterium]|nr:DUF885 family protein [Planctomycetota bacterium]